jgi:RHS repeat-associated protein
MVVASAGTVLTTNLTFYDSVGNVQYSVSDRGAVTQNEYDPAGRLTNSLVYTTYTFFQSGNNTPSPSGPCQSTSYTYDPNGNQTTVTDPADHTTTSLYDDADRVVEVDEPGANGGTCSTYTDYDGLGRKIDTYDEEGVETGFTYDFRGLLTSVTVAMDTPQAATTVYQYDEVGNEIAQIDAAGRTTTFHCDALGRRTGRTLPAGQSESFAYDLEGNQIYHTNFNGVVITNQYDVDDHLTNCSSMSYSSAYAYSPTGLRTNMTDASGSTAYFYDELSQLTNKTVVWNGGPTVSLRYGYDFAGTVTNIESSSVNGVNLTYEYDILGRITNVLASGNPIAGYGYDVIGNLQAMQYGNGVTNLYEYDSMNRLTNLVWNLKSSPLAAFAYTLGPTGNRRSSLETVAGAGRYYGWSYDNLYRLTNEMIRGATIGNVSYGYDAVGNRINRTSSLAGLNNQAPVYNPNDWMTNTDGYDADGNTTNSSEKSYQYDVLDHLTNVNNGQIIMAYDGDGNRVSKAVNGTTTCYLVDDVNPSGYSQVLEEWTSTGTPELSQVYNYGLDLISQVQPGVSTNYFILDGHGSTRMLADNGGNIVNAFAYDAFGNLVTSNGVSQTAYLYCGQQFDSDLGFYLNRARYLNPNTGRFWTMDGDYGNNEDSLSLHKYLYAEDNPMNMDDPSGDYTVAEILAPLFNISSSAGGANVPTAGGVVLPLSQLGSYAPPYPVVVVTLNGKQSMPETTVKDGGQASQIPGSVTGMTRIYIAVPPSVDPQGLVNQWAKETGSHAKWPEFAWFWRPGGDNDYKKHNALWDAFGNFEYGATGAAAGFTLKQLEDAGDDLHPNFSGGLLHPKFQNNSINKADIKSGFDAIKNGGTLSIQQESIVPPPSSP